MQVMKFRERQTNIHNEREYNLFSEHAVYIQGGQQPQKGMEEWDPHTWFMIMHLSQLFFCWEATLLDAVGSNHPTTSPSLTK